MVLVKVVQNVEEGIVSWIRERELSLFCVPRVKDIVEVAGNSFVVRRLVIRENSIDVVVEDCSNISIPDDGEKERYDWNRTEASETIDDDRKSGWFVHTVRGLSGVV